MHLLTRRSFCLSIGALTGASAWAGPGPEFVRGSVPVDGATISYIVRKSRGPALVLVPGSFDSASQWTEVIAGLDKDLTIAVVELRGHGKSWPPPVNGTIPGFTRDVLAAVDRAGLRQFYIGGHSIGGMIAIEAAGQYPRRLQGVIAIEGWTHHSVAADAFHGQISTTLTPAMQAHVLELRKPYMPRWQPEQVNAFRQIWRQWDGYRILKDTGLPVLELWGDRGEAVPSRAVMKIPDRPNIELIWFHGASHSLPTERPAEVARAINQFIARTAHR